VPFFDSSREIRELRADLVEGFGRVLDKAHFILGSNVVEFEKSFASWLGASHAIGVANGTDAITIALQATGIKSGDQVLTVANTCIPTATAILRAGAELKLADVDPETLLVSRESLEKSLTLQTRALVVVNLYGSAPDYSEIMELARERGLVLIEDCAQSTGTEFQGRKVGNFGQVSTFSFYPTKNLGAYGDGGAVVTSDDGVAERARLIRNYGKKNRDECVLVGMNSRLDEVQAAILSLKLKSLDRWNRRRQEIATRYQSGLSGLGLQIPKLPPGVTHTYHLMPVLVKAGVDRDTVRRKLLEKGIETLVHYPIPIHLLESMQFLGYRKGDLPHAEAACDRLITLPMYPQLTNDEVDRICDACSKIDELRI
jgi:dTDP-3-amino-2,3,6-trideoxy-4-keto-D-glucose/dTDP-3-amino-3,4,6-trideoxy-alpha-D-glucose/dTDP-2,6-dideoxy-D-kanosamine transaminase